MSKNHRRIAERKYAGSYDTRRVEDGVHLADPNRMTMATAMPVEMGREPSGSSMGIHPTHQQHPMYQQSRRQQENSAQYYDQYRATDYRQNVVGRPPQAHHTHDDDKKKYDEYRLSSASARESLTDLHGPCGTSGKDPRRMDSSECIPEHLVLQSSLVSIA